MYTLTKTIFTVDKSIPGYCILTVEGTSSMDDWVTNLKFIIKSDDTHRGFKEKRNENSCQYGSQLRVTLS
jgi:hypothetical protein